MRTKVILALAAVLLSGWSLFQDFAFKTETKHYAIQSRIPADKLQDFTKYMELVFTTYTRLLQVDKIPDKKFPLLMYANEQEYMTEARGPGGVAAFYDPGSKKLVGYYKDDRLSMYNIFAHEGMHQFTDMAIPDFNAISDKAPWYVEGIADCIGNSTVKDGKLYMCIMDGAITGWRCFSLYNLKKQDKLWSLKKLLSINHKDFYADMEGGYCHAWAFCHFLLTAPKLEDLDKQVPDGKYKKFVALFHEALSKKWTLDKAYDEAFSHGKGGAKMPSMDELDAEWKKYIDQLLALYEPKHRRLEEELKKFQTAWPPDPDDMLIHLNDWDKEDLDLLERPDAYKKLGRGPRETTTAWVMHHKKRFQELGIAIKWDPKQKLYVLAK